MGVGEIMHCCLFFVCFFFSGPFLRKLDAHSANDDNKILLSRIVSMPGIESNKKNK